MKIKITEVHEADAYYEDNLVGYVGEFKKNETYIDGVPDGWAAGVFTSDQYNGNCPITLFGIKYEVLDED